MRVAPVGLLYHDKPEELRRVAELSASITHAHPVGKEGAALQAYAVACAVNSEIEEFSPQAFLEKLKVFLSPECEPLRQKLETISALLNKKPSISEVVTTLGNDVSADGSVPAAIYAFLANPASFKNAVVYAVSLGGDTDTIGAMTGAIAGAFHGVDAIPTSWLEAMENRVKGRDYVRDLAALLWEQV
jgi:poly(ADP-ribose) glycohydrolase ARH3